MSKKLDTDLYLHGRCHLYALVSSKMTGYNVEMLWDDDYWHENAESPSKVLIHAYVVNERGQRFDAYGLLTDERLNEEYEWNHAVFEQYSPADIKNMITRNILENFEKGEENTLTEHLLLSLTSQLHRIKKDNK